MGPRHRSRAARPLCRVVAAILAAIRAEAAGAAQEPAPQPGASGGAGSPRFITSRSGRNLGLPSGEGAFTFVVFGDRTGGPAEGIRVLEDAVREVNLLRPDLVMTVGDLVEGYNEADQWMAQMREYRDAMDGLACAWFPVAGNHDIYWRGPGKPPGEHEAHYEEHFGPLWYAFEHKGCWFIVLYSDEGDPATGEKSFEKPAAQVMSPQQRSWLRRTLELAEGASNVFVFLHHPRWLRGGYGDDWDGVHADLALAGNVRAVFAGHIHRMRYDGPRDGIEYVTLATTGGSQSGSAPAAGYLHQYHVVTVRDSGIAIAAIPVGHVMDARAVTGAVSDEAAALAKLVPTVAEPLALDRDGAADGAVRATVANPTSRPIEATLRLESDDARWTTSPDHRHVVIEPGGTAELLFAARRRPAPVDETFRPLRLVRSIDYLAEALRVPIPQRAMGVPLRPDLRAPAVPAGERAARLDGKEAFLSVESDRIAVPDGPLTLECWLMAESWSGRRGIVTKTEESEFGLFGSDGIPAFLIFVGGRYLVARSDEPLLGVGRWHHIAGVYDGAEARLYLDGVLVGAWYGAGPRRVNRLPLFVGADVDRRGQAVSHFAGWIDEVRVSAVARYAGARIEPQRRQEPDEHALLLLHMDGAVGPWVCDASGRAAHPVLLGGAGIEDVPVGP